MIAGKGTLSLRKTDLSNQKIGAKAFRRIIFAHKATAGETGIDLMNMVVPTEMTTNGFTQPSKAELAAAAIKLNRPNLRLASSLQPDMKDYLEYTVNSNTRIEFVGFTAAQDEIFVGMVDLAPTTGAMIVDASPIIATGVLAAGATDINVGVPFSLNKYPTHQSGAVTVFIDGQQVFRNTGNSGSVLDANYYEVDAGNGLSSMIRMNTADAINARSYLVLSHGVVAERPAGSQMAFLESVQGQVNKLIEVVSDVSGLAEAAFQAAPSYIDLKNFGDRFLNVETPFKAGAFGQLLIGQGTGSYPSFSSTIPAAISVGSTGTPLAATAITSVVTDGQYGILTRTSSTAGQRVFLGLWGAQTSDATVASIEFVNQGPSPATIAQIYATRTGANNSGRLFFEVRNVGAAVTAGNIDTIGAWTIGVANTTQALFGGVRVSGGYYQNNTPGANWISTTATPTYSIVMFGGGGPFNVCGMALPANPGANPYGLLLYIINRSGGTISVLNESVTELTADRRFRTKGGVTLSIPAGEAKQFIWSETQLTGGASAVRWIEL